MVKIEVTIKKKEFNLFLEVATKNVAITIGHRYNDWTVLPYVASGGKVSPGVWTTTINC